MMNQHFHACYTDVKELEGLHELIKPHVTKSSIPYYDKYQNLLHTHNTKYICIFSPFGEGMN